MTKPHIKAHSFIPQNINNFLQHHVLHFLRGFNFVLDRNLVMVQHKFNNTSESPALLCGKSEKEMGRYFQQKK